jgi:hypothetical protein
MSVLLTRSRLVLVVRLLVLIRLVRLVQTQYFQLLHPQAVVEGHRKVLVMQLQAVQVAALRIFLMMTLEAVALEQLDKVSVVVIKRHQYLLKGAEVVVLALKV